MTPPDQPSTFFGFTRAEWRLALANRPDESASLLKLIDDFQAGAFDTSGVLIGIDPDALIAVAEVSRVFAGRLRAELDRREPNWRQRVADMRATLPMAGNTSESPEAQWTRRWVTKWSSLQGLLDYLGGSGVRFGGRLVPGGGLRLTLVFNEEQPVAYFLRLGRHADLSTICVD